MISKDAMDKKLEWLYALDRKGIKLGLERVEAIGDSLGNPQDSFRSIHIAGTNGKGSVAKFIYSILCKQGYSVGLYTSPHLQRFNERIIVDNKEIEDADILRYIDIIKAAVDRDNIDASFFEFTTFMAFLHFKEHNVDFAVVETGLGGRLDATNVITPIVSVITNVSPEHQKYLGETVEKIAFEKAGIIKPGVPVITHCTGNALDVVEDIAGKNGASVLKVPELVSVEVRKDDISGQEAGISTKKETYDIATSLLGSHQLDNIATAIIACELIKGLVELDKDSMEDGIRKTRWPARFEIVRKDSLVIIDCSHNVACFKVLRNLISRYIISEDRKITLVLGISDDKDKEGMISQVADLVDKVVICAAEYRGTDTAILAGIVRKHNSDVVEKGSVAAALDYALSISGEDDAIIITGSIFTAGEAKDHLDRLHE